MLHAKCSSRRAPAVRQKNEERQHPQIVLSEKIMQPSSKRVDRYMEDYYALLGENSMPVLRLFQIFRNKNISQINNT